MSSLFFRCYVARSGGSFGERFGYGCWLMHLRTGRAPTWAQIGAAVDRNGVSVAAWLKMDRAPDKHSLRQPLADYLGVPVAWLMDDEGDPPQPDLWAVWSKARRRPLRHEPAVEVEVPARAGKGRAAK